MGNYIRIKNIGQALFENLFLNGINIADFLSFITTHYFFEKKPAIDVNFVKYVQPPNFYFHIEFML